jgi:anti-sigma factor RsiW
MDMKQNPQSSLRKLTSLSLAAWLPLAMLMLGASHVTAAVTLNVATGGSAISADTAGGTPWTTLTGPAILETTSGQQIGTGVIELDAPAGFNFNTLNTVSATVAKIGGSQGILQLASGTATMTTITITVTRSSVGNEYCSITWSGIQV